MANKIFVLGNTGTGKSTALRNLDPDTTFILQCVKKQLPFPGWKGKYKKVSKGPNGLTGNLGYSPNYTKALEQLKFIGDHMKHIKTIILDDSNYLMTNDFMGRVTEKTVKGEAFKKYNEMAYNFHYLIQFITDNLSDDINVIIMSHTQENDNGTRSFKTVGKLLDGTVNLEGLVSYIFESKLKEGRYVFQTNLVDGYEPCKTPMGCFEEKFIDNDLKVILEKIHNYENGQ